MQHVPPAPPIVPFAFYGTLMGGERRGGFLGDIGAYEGPVLISGDLYDVHGSFPALVPGTGKVVGQLWRPYPGCEQQAFEVLDGIEGYRASAEHSSLYLRRQVTLLEPEVQAYTYLWNGGCRSLTPIPSGDWRRHCAEARVAA